MNARDASERLAIALDLAEAAEEMLRERLAREGLDAAEIERRVVEWYATRPGAEDGDAPGRRVPFPREPR